MEMPQYRFMYESYCRIWISKHRIAKEEAVLIPFPSKQGSLDGKGMQAAHQDTPSFPKRNHHLSLPVNPHCSIL